MIEEIEELGTELDVLRLAKRKPLNDRVVYIGLFGPRKTLRPTLPKSVPVAAAMAVPFELGIS